MRGILVTNGSDTIPFGRHKGERYTRLPVSYLQWLVNEGTSVADTARAELSRRGTVWPEVEISGHAIDRASLNNWQRFAEQREGLHAWLARTALAALKNGSVIGREDDGTEKRSYLGWKWVFVYGEVYPTLKTVMPPRHDAGNCGD
jgi:hypothetical protein